MLRLDTFVLQPPLSISSLRRRFEQNQEDCTYTVLALVPTIRDEIISCYPVEQLSGELQKQKAERLARSVGGLSEVASTDIPSGPPSTIDDGSSLAGSFVHASQMAESTQGGQLRSKKSKVQLWYDMKVQCKLREMVILIDTLLIIVAITRSLTLLYTLSLLTLLTRIQLNLLGRRTYLSSVVSLASPPTGQQASVISLENNDDDNYDNVYGSDFETNRKYLTFSWWLLHKGCKEIAGEVEQAVKAVFGPVNPREDVTLEKLSALILEVRKKVEGVTEVERSQHKWLPYLLPPREQEETVLREQSSSPSAESPPPDAEESLLVVQSGESRPVDINPSLRRLLDETSDLIDSPTFTHVLTQLLNSGFATLVDNHVAAEAFKIPPVNPEAPIDPMKRITDLTERKVKLAQTLAVFCRQAHAISAGSSDMDDLGATSEPGAANEYLAAIDKVPDLEAFAAVIYSSNFEFEAVEHIREQQQEQKRHAEAETEAEVKQQDPLPAEEEVELLPQVQLKEPQASGFEDAWNKALDKSEESPQASGSAA